MIVSHYRTPADPHDASRTERAAARQPLSYDSPDDQTSGQPGLPSGRSEADAFVVPNKICPAETEPLPSSVSPRGTEAAPLTVCN